MKKHARAIARSNTSRQHALRKLNDAQLIQAVQDAIPNLGHTGLSKAHREFFEEKLKRVGHDFAAYGSLSFAQRIDAIDFLSKIKGTKK